MLETLKGMFNRANALHTLGALALFVAGYFGLTTQDAGQMVMTAAGGKILFLAIGKLMFSQLADKLKDGSLVASVTTEGKFDLHKLLTFLQGLTVAGAVGAGFLEPNALASIHAVSIAGMGYAVLSFFSNQLLHFNIAQFLNLNPDKKVG